MKPKRADVAQPRLHASCGVHRRRWDSTFAPLCRPKILPVLLPRFTNPRYLAYALFGPDLSVDAVVGDTGGAVGGTDEVPQASSSARAPAQSDREVAGVPVRCGVAAVSLARSRTTAEPLHRRSGVERPENMGRGEPTGKSSPSTQPAPPTVRKDHPQDRYGCSCDLPAGPQLSLVLRGASPRGRAAEVLDLVAHRAGRPARGRWPGRCHEPAALGPNVVSDGVRRMGQAPGGGATWPIRSRWRCLRVGPRGPC